MIGSKKILARLRSAKAMLRLARHREVGIAIDSLICGLLQHHHNTDADQLEMRLAPAANAVVHGCPLGWGMTVRACVARQIAGDPREMDADRPVELARHDKKRGTCPDGPHCVTARCAVGEAIRRACGDQIAQGVKIPVLDSSRR
jgi:hypothetical protein